MAKKMKKAKPAKKAKAIKKAKVAKPAKKAKAAKGSKAAPKKVFKPRKSHPIVPPLIVRRNVDLIIPKPKDAGHERPLTAKQIQDLRDLLVEKREELQATVQRKKEQEIQVGESEIGDEADIATRSVEKELLFETTDTEKQTLDMVEAALIRIEKGVYGNCESCHNPISKMRLEYTPWVRYCISCQSGMEIPTGE